MLAVSTQINFPELWDRPIGKTYRVKWCPNGNAQVSTKNRQKYENLYHLLQIFRSNMCRFFVFLRYKKNIHDANALKL